MESGKKYYVRVRLYGSEDTGNFRIYFGKYNEVIPDLVLPSNTRRIESEAFAGVMDVFIRIPDDVDFIADNAFDPSVTIICSQGSNAEELCNELGLYVMVQ